MDDRDTIYALSSGLPPVAVAVIRVSGPRARFGLETLAGRLPQPRRASLAKLRDPATQVELDDALILWFPGPNSETGEDSAEFQIHGGRAVIAAVLGALGRIPGFRPAEAGEFTRRAFENGRLDLTKVEGLGDLIHAETEAQRQLAYRQMNGVLGQRVEEWRGRLIEAIALVEASIDFSDEADVPQGLLQTARLKAAEIRDEIEAVLKSDSRAERLREGLKVVLCGPPNAGKSSLFNRIAGREAAIVTPFPGTTRDPLQIHLDLQGYPVTLVDTAGLRDSDDPIEVEGIKRARMHLDQADLMLWVTSCDAQSKPAIHSIPIWNVINKVDLAGPDIQTLKEQDASQDTPQFTSAKSGAGIDQLLDRLRSFAQDYLSGTPSAIISRERHRNALCQTADQLSRSLNSQSGEEILAEHLRSAAGSLGRLVGRVDPDEFLEVIFKSFCIGK